MISKFRECWDLRSWFLFILSLGAIARGWAYRPGVATDNPPDALRYLPASISLEWWAWIWIAVGIFGVLVALTGYKHPEGARVAGFALFAMGSMWGLTYFSGWFISIHSGDPNNDWFSGSILICTAIGTALGALISIRLDLALQENETLKAERVIAHGEKALLLREIEALKDPR